MNKNSMKIRSGIRALCYQPYELMSGTVVAGSLDEDANTISVKLCDGATVIERVMLNVVTHEQDGLIIVPEDESNVIICSVDGPGEWALVRACKMTRAIIKTGSVKYEMDSAGINLQNGGVVINLGDGVVKLNTASESLFGILKDLITAIKAITVTVSSAASGVPNNVLAFTELQTRLGNLLSD